MCKAHGELQTLAHLSLASDSDASIERTACTFTRKSFLIHGTTGQSGIQKSGQSISEHLIQSTITTLPLQSVHSSLCRQNRVPCSSLEIEKKILFFSYSRMLNKKAPHLLIPSLQAQPPFPTRSCAAKSHSQPPSRARSVPPARRLLRGGTRPGGDRRRRARSRESGRCAFFGQSVRENTPYGAKKGSG